jgi:Enoyl-CoA hydratase/isomerase
LVGFSAGFTRIRSRLTGLCWPAANRSAWVPRDRLEIGDDVRDIEEEMHFVRLSTNDGSAEAKIPYAINYNGFRLKRGKVNAFNEQAVQEIDRCFQRLAADPGIRAVIFTGDGPFFSFGFDIPEFLSYSNESFSSFLKRFTSLYTYLFTYPKPIVATLNGHGDGFFRVQKALNRTGLPEPYLFKFRLKEEDGARLLSNQFILSALRSHADVSN